MDGHKNGRLPPLSFAASDIHSFDYHCQSHCSQHTTSTPNMKLTAVLALLATSAIPMVLAAPIPGGKQYPFMTLLQPPDAVVTGKH